MLDYYSFTVQAANSNYWIDDAQGIKLIEENAMKELITEEILLVPSAKPIFRIGSGGSAG